MSSKRPVKSETFCLKVNKNIVEIVVDCYLSLCDLCLIIGFRIHILYVNHVGRVGTLFPLVSLFIIAHIGCCYQNTKC